MPLLLPLLCWMLCLSSSCKAHGQFLQTNVTSSSVASFVHGSFQLVAHTTCCRLCWRRGSDGSDALVIGRSDQQLRDALLLSKVVRSSPEWKAKGTVSVRPYVTSTRMPLFRNGGACRSCQVSGAWYNDSIAFSHQGHIAKCDIRFDATKRRSDVIVRVIHDPGWPSTVLYNILGDGRWKVLSCEAMTIDRGGRAQRMELQPPEGEA